MDEFNDPVRQFTCMRSAADADIAPVVRYRNAEDGISIIDFRVEKSFPVSVTVVEIPGVLQRLHSLAPFPKAFNYVTSHKGTFGDFARAGLLLECEEVFARYEQLCAAYPCLDSDTLSCHMDLKPENILFDGDRVWLIDWQAVRRRMSTNGRDST